MRPVWDQLERPGAAARVWQASQTRFLTKVLGPHFEQVCREWALHHADPELFGGLPARVGHGQVHDPAARTGHQVDVAVIGIPEDDGPTPLLALGEAKWNATVGDAHLARLAHIRDLVARTGRYDTSTTRLICLSGGFSPRLHERATSQPDLLLVGLADLYTSSR